MVGSDPEPHIAELFCHYNIQYFQDTLNACIISWAEEPLPYGDISGCDYYPGGGGCIIFLSKSLYECHIDSDLKNALLHEMIHAYMFIKDGNTNHSDHGANFQKLMNVINSRSVPDPHRPVGGYNIVMLHERKKQYQYKCESCDNFIESTKINEPSQDGCIELMGDVCLNSTCQWHRHKMQCSGSYYRIQESSSYCVELKGSRAYSTKQRLDECKADKSASGRWHTKHTSNKIEAINKHELEDASAEFLHPTDDAIGNSGKKGSTSCVTSNKKIKLSNNIGFDHLTSATVQEALKRPRKYALSKNQDRNGEKKRKISKWDGSYSVIIEHVNYYCVDDSDEDEVLLINKRTERRKRQKLLENPEAIYMESNNGVWDTIFSSQVITFRSDSCFDSFPQGPRGKDGSGSLPLSQVEEMLLPNHLVSNHGVAEDQTSHETLPSPS